ncbi:hypothetical protein D3C80_1702770 [compost metagenome]
MAFADFRLAAGQQRIGVFVILCIFRPVRHKSVNIAGIVGIKLLLNHLFRA